MRKNILVLMGNNFYYIIIQILFFFCASSVCSRDIVPDSISDVLEKSGRNKTSLMQLLNKYKSDKERFAAVCYLINGMQYHEQGGRVISYDYKIDSLWREADKSYYALVKNATVDEQEHHPLILDLIREMRQASNQNNGCEGHRSGG